MKRGRKLQYRKYNELTLALFFTLGPCDIQPHLGITQHTYDICRYTHTNIVIEPVIQREFRVLGKSISLKAEFKEKKWTWGKYDWLQKK